MTRLKVVVVCLELISYLVPANSRNLSLARVPVFDFRKLTIALFQEGWNHAERTEA